MVYSLMRLHHAAQNKEEAMAKGFDANRERLDLIGSFGKNLAKRAAFTCEWCGGKNDLRTWDYRPDQEPTAESLALLCARCRELAGGSKAQSGELRSLQGALWSDVPSVAQGAAQVLARSREPWVREAIEESLIEETVKEELLKGL